MADQTEPYRATNHSRNPHFTDDLLRLFGADFDPDPLFLEECWTFGVPTAAENLHRRRQEPQRSAAEIASGYDDIWQHTWTPADWAPSDRVEQSRIPHGWMPQDVPQPEAPQETKSVAHPWDYMTLSHARELLGVSAANTPQQIRSAYRHMVSTWHPDRLQYASEAVREHATQQMAAINVAYRVLCPAPQFEAA